MAKAKALTPAKLSKLVQMADSVLASDYCWSFLARAEDDKAWFFGLEVTKDGTPESTETSFMENRRFGQLWTDKDYAFRVLSNPAHRAQMATDISEANEYRTTHPDEDNPAFDVAVVTETANKVLDTLAGRQTVDVIMDVEYDGGFFDDFIGEIIGYHITGEIEVRE